VTGLAVLALLLVGSYLGGFFVGGRKGRARGVASGAGVVVLGFVAGPSVLSLINQETLELFTPLTQVGVGWLAMDSGLVYGRVLGRRIQPTRALWGIAVAVFTAAAVAGALTLALAWVPRLQTLDLGPRERWVLVLGVSAALAETTRSVFRWAREHGQARGPLFDRLVDLAAGDDLVPVVMVAVAFAFEPLPSAFGPLPVLAGAAAQLVCGWLVGAASALMIGRTFQLNVFRGVLLGVTLLAIGFASRLGVSLLAVPFGVGLGLASVSRHRARIRRAASSERYLLIPVLLLAGAMTPVEGILPWLAAGAVGLRLLAKALAGLGLWAAWREARPAGPLLGLALTSSGALSICVGLSFALRFPGLVGGTVLAASTLAVVVGEFLGPATLRRALTRAGEVDATTVEPVPAAAVGVTP
jgi:hypothetical protein